MCTVPTFLCYYYWELRKLKTTLSKGMLGNNKQAQLSTGCILVSNPTLLNNNNDNNNESYYFSISLMVTFFWIVSARNHYQPK